MPFSRLHIQIGFHLRALFLRRGHHAGLFRLHVRLHFGLLHLHGPLHLGLFNLHLRLNLHLVGMRGILHGLQFGLHLLRVRLGEIQINRFQASRFDHLGRRVVNLIRLYEWVIRPECHKQLFLHHHHLLHHHQIALARPSAEPGVDRAIHRRIPVARVKLHPLIAQPDRAGHVLMFDHHLQQPAKEALQTVRNGPDHHLGLADALRLNHRAGLGSHVLQGVRGKPARCIGNARTFLRLVIHVFQHGKGIGRHERNRVEAHCRANINALVNLDRQAEFRIVNRVHVLDRPGLHGRLRVVLPVDVIQGLP